MTEVQIYIIVVLGCALFWTAIIQAAIR